MVPVNAMVFVRGFMLVKWKKHGAITNPAVPKQNFFTIITLFLVMAEPALVDLILLMILWIIIPLSYPSSVAFNLIQVPSSYDVIGTQDPFDFFDPDATIASNECFASSVSLTDGDSSSLFTVQHTNKGTERVTPSLSTNTGAGRVTLSTSTPFSGARRLTDRFDVSMYPKLTQAS